MTVLGGSIDAEYEGGGYVYTMYTPNLYPPPPFSAILIVVAHYWLMLLLRGCLYHWSHIFVMSTWVVLTARFV